jgi:hypothetical protein
MSLEFVWRSQPPTYTHPSPFVGADRHARTIASDAKRSLSIIRQNRCVKVCMSDLLTAQKCFFKRIQCGHRGVAVVALDLFKMGLLDCFITEVAQQ